MGGGRCHLDRSHFPLPTSYLWAGKGGCPSPPPQRRLPHSRFRLPTRPRIQKGGRILLTPRWTTPLALVALALPVALAGQDAPSAGGNAAATQTSPSTLVARLATVWRAYADGRIEQFPYSFPRHIAFVRDNDLWLLDIGTGSVTQTTHLGRPYTDSQASVFVLVTEWSSDSRRLLYHVMAGETEDMEGMSPELEVRGSGVWVPHLRHGVRRKPTH